MQEKLEEMFVGLVAQKVIIERDGKVLFVRSDLEKGKWDLPGGRLHVNEHPKAGIMREVKEELGIDCNLDRVVCVGQFYHDSAQKPCLFISYAASIADQAVINLPEDELAAYEWIDYRDCTEDNIYKNCVAAVRAYFQAV